MLSQTSQLMAFQFLFDNCSVTGTQLQALPLHYQAPDSFQSDFVHCEKKNILNINCYIFWIYQLVLLIIEKCI